MYGAGVLWGEGTPEQRPSGPPTLGCVESPSLVGTQRRAIHLLGLLTEHLM